LLTPRDGNAFLLGDSVISARSGLRCQSTGRLVLTAKRPKSSKYPKTLISFGDHLRARRLELELIQAEVARALGVTESTVTNWEKNRTTPTLRQIPRIIEFLGYEPRLNSDQTLGRRIRTHRQYRGWSQKELAKKIGIDPTTLSRLERGKGRRLASVLKRVTAFFSGDTHKTKE